MYDPPASVAGNKLDVCAQQVKRADESSSIVSCRISSAVAKFEPATIFGHSTPFFC